ncbi:MAG: Ig-like domain-containing protein [Desulfobacterium sp.]|nr:Ig-like domain-containing protein [Desulfobacterium sp.]
MEMVDATTDAAVTEVGFDDIIKLKVKVTAPDGKPAAGRRVEAAFENEQCQFIDSSDGSDVTDANGQVEMSFKLVAGASIGSNKVTVTSDIPGDSTDTPPSDFKNFTIDKTNVAGTIEFVSATPTLIGLSGATSASSLPSQSTVEFIVKDNQTNPVYNQTVNFSLSTAMGGLTLDPTSAETDSEGKVKVVVKSGILPTSVRVKAEVEYTTLSTLSSELILSTGFPDQNSFSISADILNPEAMAYDGEKVNITVRAADINNNPVPDGTAIYFTTEGGNIQSTGYTQNGACSVEWTSQDPRPDTPSSPLTHNGRVTILAHAVGEESFQDLNGNGLYDSGSELLLTDLAEAFLDRDYNGARDLDENFVDFNNDTLYTPADGMYNGTLYAPGSVNCATDLIHVRDSIQIVMAESFANIEFTPSSTILFSNTNDTRVINITLSGTNYGNSLPNGTHVEVIPPENAEISGKASFTVANGIGPNLYSVVLVPKDDGDVLATTEDLRVEVTTPKNNYSSARLSVTAPPKALFAASDGDAATGTVIFQDRSTSAPGSSITSWLWKFGDGSTSTSPNPSRAYGNTSKYMASLTVTNNLGQSNTYSEEVTPPSPEAAP